MKRNAVIVVVVVFVVFVLLALGYFFRPRWQVVYTVYSTAFGGGLETYYRSREDCLKALGKSSNVALQAQSHPTRSYPTPIPTANDLVAAVKMLFNQSPPPTVSCNPERRFVWAIGD